MGNESKCGTNKSRELRSCFRGSRDLFVPHCESFPINREKKTLIPLKKKIRFQYIHVFTLVLHAAG